VESLLTISDHNEYLRRAWFITLAEFPRTIWVLAAGAVVIYLHFSDFYPEMLGSGSEGIAWPWYLPMGVGITVGLGYLLSGPREAGSEPRPA
jgi:hypothetical protein